MAEAAAASEAAARAEAARLVLEKQLRQEAQLQQVCVYPCQCVFMPVFPRWYVLMSPDCALVLPQLLVHNALRQQWREGFQKILEGSLVGSILCVSGLSCSMSL